MFSFATDATAGTVSSTPFDSAIIYRRGYADHDAVVYLGYEIA